MSNLKAEFELKPSAEYKKTAREIAKIVYKGDKFMRYCKTAFQIKVNLRLKSK